MIMEYYEEFGESNPHLFPKHVKGFERYIQEHNIPQSKVYDSIEAYVETVPVTTRTKRNYRHGLRRYVEKIARNYW